MRTVAGRRGDADPKPQGSSGAPAAPTGPVYDEVSKRHYPVSDVMSMHRAIERVMELCKYPRWQAVAAVSIAVAMRANTEPAPGGLIEIRVVPGGFVITDKTGRGL